MSGKIVILWGSAALRKVLRAAFRRRKGLAVGQEFLLPSFSSGRTGLSQFKAADVAAPAASVWTLCARTRQAGLCVTNKVILFTNQI